MVSGFVRSLLLLETQTKGRTDGDRLKQILKKLNCFVLLALVLIIFLLLLFYISVMERCIMCIASRHQVKVKNEI
jgi:hypothetical protein